MRLRRRRVLWWTLGIVGALVVAAGVVAALIVPKALQAREALTSSIPLVSKVQQSVLAGDTPTATATAAELTAKTEVARDATSGALWRALEWIPVAGANLAAVRVAAEATDELADGAIVPVSGLSVSALAPKDGRLDLAALDAVISTVKDVTASVQGAQKLMTQVDRSALIGPVKSGVAQLDDALGRADSMLSDSQPLLDALPAMLGAGGARDVLVIFQNNGEVMPAGGTVGSLAQLHIDQGAVSIVAQASAARTDMPTYDEPVVPVPDDARDLYGPQLGTYVQSLTRTPRFDLTFDIAREMWRLKSGTTVDAVIGLDVVALTQLLKATGPIKMNESLTLSADNAVPLLLGGLYDSYSPPEVDVINQVFAAETMSRLLSGQVAVPALLSALGPSIDEGRVRIWSAREDEQALIAGSPFDHRLPASSADEAPFGVYFVDKTPSKMARFLQQSVTVERTSCSPEQAVRVTVALTNSVTAEQVPSLPDYVTGGGASTPVGDLRLSALVYAPAGFALTAADVGGLPFRGGTDGDFGVVELEALLAPGQTRTLVMEFRNAGSAGAPTLSTTPVVNPTSVTVDDACAG